MAHLAKVPPRIFMAWYLKKHRNNLLIFYIKIMVLRDVMQYSSVNRYQRFGIA